MTNKSKLMEIKKEFANKHGSNIDEAFVRLGMKPYAYRIWDFVESAILQSKQEVVEEAVKKIDELWDSWANNTTDSEINNQFKEAISSLKEEKI